MDVLFFEEHINAQAFQLSDGFQKSDGVSGKAGNALCNDHIDFPGTAVCQHLLKAVPVALGSGQGFVAVNAAVDPAGMGLDHFAVMTWSESEWSIESLPEETRV